MLNIRLYLFLSLLICYASAKAQTGFECDGSAILSIVDANEETRFFTLNSGSQGIELSPISGNLPFNVNAIGFNRQDQMVYGVDPERHDLFRFDAEGNIESLIFLPLEGDFYAGDISPQGGILTLVNSDSIAMVDLNSVESPILYTPLQTTLDSVSFVFVTDIAYHPITGVLYAFDAILGKLVTIDPLTGLIDNERFPAIGYNSSIPALYFDARGVLFGIATDNMDQSAILFEFDLETGEAKRTSVNGNVGDRDACSCPYTVKVFQELSSYEGFPCDEIEVIITVSNLNGSSIDGADLREAFPQHFLIKEINNPLTSGNTIGIESNNLEITDMNIPEGIHEISVILEVSSFAFGQFDMQAELILPPGTGALEGSIFSDDVLSPDQNETSTLDVLNFSNIFQAAIPDTLELCMDDSVAIEIPVSENLTYLWSDGLSIPSRSFEEAGNYSLRISSNCDSIVLETEILLSPFSLDLGLDRTVNFGSLLSLEAEVNSLSPIVNYQWFNQEVDIPCFNCPVIQINPQEDSEYTLIAENEAGCTATDQIFIRVTREVYAPNIISADANGFNDFFYLQSANPPVQLNFLKIYDRWGSLVFRAEDISTNVESAGWNGRAINKKYVEGIYIWTAELLFPDGKTEFKKGEFLLTK